MLDGMDKLMTMDLTPEQQTQMHKVHTELKAMMAEMMAGQGAAEPSADAADAPAADQTDHAAHHPQGQNAPGGEAGGMMGDMGGMMDMDAMMKMHARMQDMMGMMDKMQGMEMSPAMKAMMGDMKGMMDGMMKDMPMGEMMGGQGMGAMQEMPMAPMQAMGSASPADAQAERMMGMMDKMLGMMDEMMGMMKGMPGMGAMNEQGMGDMQMEQAPCLRATNTQPITRLTNPPLRPRLAQVVTWPAWITAAARLRMRAATLWRRSLAPAFLLQLSQLAGSRLPSPKRMA